MIREERFDCHFQNDLRGSLPLLAILFRDRASLSLGILLQHATSSGAFLLLSSTILHLPPSRGFWWSGKPFLIWWVHIDNQFQNDPAGSLAQLPGDSQLLSRRFADGRKPCRYGQDEIGQGCESVSNRSGRITCATSLYLIPNPGAPCRQHGKRMERLPGKQTTKRKGRTGRPT